MVWHTLSQYKKVEDAQFDTYIMVTQFGYIADPDTYDPRTLRNRVENLYKMRVQAGTWKPVLSNKSNN
jgi:hypothetical protein